MRLEHLRDMDFTHRRESPYDELFTYVAACGTQEAGLYGERDALWGERLGGTAGFVNHARRRGDGVSLADINGFIRPDDGAFAPFTIHGRTPPSHDGKRRLRGLRVLEGEHNRYT